VAGDPQTLVDAVGAYFGHSRAVMVTLWQVIPPSDAPESQVVPPELLLLSSWVAKKVLPLADQMQINAGRYPVLTRLQEKEPFIFQVDELSAEERDAWVRLGARTVLLLPLTSSTDELIGVLMMNSQAAGGFARNIWRANLINTQVALALENIQLLEEAKQTAVLEERQRLAREIHDTIAQDFTSIVMHLEAAEQSLAGNLDTTHRHMDQARQTARDGLSQARQLVWALRPEILQREPLPVAVERVVTRWSEQNGVPAKVQATGTLIPLHPEVEVTLLRATQEALTNIRKHAQAGRVTVTLSYMGDLVALDVQDDGVGFEPDQVAAQHTSRGLSSFGLTAMRERVEQLNGQLLVESAPGQGTTLVIKIPTPASLQGNHTARPIEDGER
jgi:signal transduction histidine kinase